MADIKISALPAATAVTAADVAPIVSGGVTSKATGTQIVTAALNATPVAIAQGGTGATTAAAARTALGVKQMSAAVPTLVASVPTAQSIPHNTQTKLAFTTVTPMTGLTWNATKVGYVNTSGATMNLIVSAQSMWAANNVGVRGEYIRVFDATDTLVYQYAQELDSPTEAGIVDYNSSCSPVVLASNNYIVVSVIQSSGANLDNGGASAQGTPGTTLTAMQLFAPV